LRKPSSPLTGLAGDIRTLSFDHGTQDCRRINRSFNNRPPFGGQIGRRPKFIQSIGLAREIEIRSCRFGELARLSVFRGFEQFGGLI